MDACIVSHHESTDFMGSFDIWTFFTEGYLDGCRSPIDEVSQFLFSHSLQRFVNLRGINLSLDNIKNRHVLALFGWRTDHDVIGMQQSPHNVKNSGLFDV